MLVKAITLFFKIFTLPFWYLQRLFPRNKKLWLFGAGEGFLYSDNSKWLFEYAIENKKGYRSIWITRNKDVFKKLKREKKPVVMTNSLKGIYYSLRAGVLFLTNSPKDFNTRAINGAYQIWLWHGVMMKQIGIDANRFSYSKLNFKGKVLREIVKLIFPEYIYKPDFVINTSDYFTPFFCSAFNLSSDKVLITGYPRNDIIFTEKKDSFVKLIDAKYQNPFKILYLPTWRKTSYGSEDRFSPFHSFNFSLQDFLQFLEINNAVFLNKSHYFDKGNPLLNAQETRFINLENDQISDLYLVLKDVDLLITDYSSVYFDFLLTGKPVILAPFDYESYISNSRPLYYDYFKEIEGIKASNWVELLEILKNKNYYSVSPATVRKFHKHPDRESSRRVIEVITDYLNI